MSIEITPHTISSISELSPIEMKILCPKGYDESFKEFSARKIPRVKESDFNDYLVGKYNRNAKTIAYCVKVEYRTQGIEANCAEPTEGIDKHKDTIRCINNISELSYLELQFLCPFGYKRQFYEYVKHKYKSEIPIVLKHQREFIVSKKDEFDNHLVDVFNKNAKFLMACAKRKREANEERIFELIYESKNLQDHPEALEVARERAIQLAELGWDGSNEMLSNKEIYKLWRKRIPITMTKKEKLEFVINGIALFCVCLFFVWFINEGWFVLACLVWILGLSFESLIKAKA